MRLSRLLLVACSFAPGLVLAQPALDSWDNLRQLRAGQKVEVVDARMRPQQGQFVDYSEEAVRLRAGNDEVTIPRKEVVSVKNREGSGRGRNTLLGLAIGAGAGALVGAVRGKTYHEEGETSVFMLVWTPIGAGIGAGVGAAMPVKQTTIYRVQTLASRER